MSSWLVSVSEAVLASFFGHLKRFLADHLTDSRDPVRIVHSLTSQMRTVILQRALGWFDQSDTQVLASDPLWHLACSDARGLTPLEQSRPSQATLSRLLTALSQTDSNLNTLHEGLLKLAVWRWNQQPKLVRPHILTLDIDGLPVEVFGHQSGSSYNGYASARIYSPLIASLAETGEQHCSCVGLPVIMGSEMDACILIQAAYRGLENI